MPLKSKTSQDFVPIKEVRDGIVTLKNGDMRAILLSSSLNFALKSEDEQTSILLQFQNFLNSLDFSVQIFIQSRRLDMRPYIAILEERYREQVSELLKIQVKEYINFVKNFTETSNIMSKSFFVVVPYSPMIARTGKTIGKFITKDTATDSSIEFEENRAQIEQRMGVVASGLSACGIRVVPLGTEEVIELYYKLFNPGDTEKPMPIGKV